MFPGSTAASRPPSWGTQPRLPCLWLCGLLLPSSSNPRCSAHVLLLNCSLVVFLRAWDWLQILWSCEDRMLCDRYLLFRDPVPYFQVLGRAPNYWPCWERNTEREKRRKGQSKSEAWKGQNRRKKPQHPTCALLLTWRFTKSPPSPSTIVSQLLL